MSASTAAGATPSTPSSLRLTSLDQFRGYTMFGMLLVNFLGGYKFVCPYVLQHHHDYCSYADTIMPHFLFAAGFAMRLSLGRRLESGGKMPWARAIRRILGLALVAIAWYGFCDYRGIYKMVLEQPMSRVLLFLFKREFFQTLLHIAATSLWILPVITSRWQVRAMYAVASGLLHLVISWWFNFEWVFSDPTGIDGGPLGFLTWAVPALCGTLACDAVRASGTAAGYRIAASGIVVMLIGWGMSNGTTLYNVPLKKEAAVVTDTRLGNRLVVKTVADTSITTPAPAEGTVPSDSKTTEPTKAVDNSPEPTKGSKLDPNKYAPDPVIPTMERIRAWDGTFAEPPFVPPPKADQRRWNYWMMSQRGGTLSYPTFAAGLSLVVYAFFLWLSDAMKIRLGFFRTLGTNSLAAYILHGIAGWIFYPYFPKTTESALFALTGFLCYTLFVYGVCRLFERMGWYIRV